MNESAPDLMQHRPKISVCMAAYNGERFIAAQLRSILCQLGDHDEVIIVDDASQDATCARISELQDPRIVLVAQEANRGLLATFGAALSRATGEIIFLSDQDDLWKPQKVETVLNAFAQIPDLMLIATDASLIDDKGNPIGNSYYAQRGKFRAGLWPNLLICKFLGCTMAFRSGLAQLALPFPRATQVHHDVWLGCVNALTGGRVLYLPEPLVEYRRHSANFTGRFRFTTLRRYRMRTQLYAALLRYSLEHRGQRTMRLRSDGPSHSA